MSASNIDKLNLTLSSIEKEIERDELDDAQHELELLNNQLQTLFNSGFEFTSIETQSLSDFNSTFNELLKKVNKKKLEAGKKIGVHLNTQKKINIYKTSNRLVDE